MLRTQAYIAVHHLAFRLELSYYLIVQVASEVDIVLVPLYLT